MNAPLQTTRASQNGHCSTNGVSRDQKDKEAPYKPPENRTVLGDLKPPEQKDRKYHVALASNDSPETKHFVQLVKASTFLPHHSAYLVDLFGRCLETKDQWVTLFARFLLQQETVARQNHDYNETHVDPKLVALGEDFESERLRVEQLIEDASAGYIEAQQIAGFSLGNELLAYDANNPIATLDHVLKPLSKESYAARLKMRYSADELVKPKRLWVSMVAKAVVGIFTGMAALSLAGFVHIASIERDPPLRLFFACALGFAVVYLGSDGLKAAFRNAADSIHRGEDRSSRIMKLAIAWTVGLVIVGLDGFIEAKGLLVREEMRHAVQSVSGYSHAASTSTGPWMLCLGTFVSVAYAVWAGFSGWNEPTTAVLNRLIDAQEAEVLALRKDKRSNIETQDAFGAVNAVAGFSWQLDHLKAELLRLQEAYHAEATRVEALRKDEVVDLTAEQKAILAQLLVEARGATSEYDRYAQLFANRVDGPLMLRFSWRWWRNWSWFNRKGA